MGMAERRVSALEEEEFYPHSFQEELNEILEAFYDAIGEEDIKEYQNWVEGLQNSRIADGAVRVGDVAPGFSLQDQDGDEVCLSKLLENGPVVLIFYRGKWCPHCNASLMRYQRELSRIKAKGASLLAISPMLPDGTQFLATKRCLEFPVLSDVGNEVANQYRLTFAVEPEFRDKFLKWGEDLPAHNGDDTWEIPLPATYVIDRDRKIVFAMVDDDPGIRAEVEHVIEAIPFDGTLEEDGEQDSTKAEKTKSQRRRASENDRYSRNSTRKFGMKRHSLPGVTFRSSIKKVFGKKKQSSEEFLNHYLK